MSTDSLFANLQFAEADKMLTAMYGNDVFKKEENDRLDAKLEELTSVLRQAFAPHIDQLIPRKTGPSLASLREAAGMALVKNETLPLRQKFWELWTNIGHLSHRLDLDEIFSNNPDIKRLANEVSSLLQIDRETEVKKEAKSMDLNALRERLRRE